tara:strand:- start:5370 stop:5861 length:492 start_codon:yes stop_codon:yes gene_type:complete
VRNLLLVRHAESSLNYSNLNDFDRTLNNMGKSDAKLMAKKLLENRFNIEHIISSGANRALSTSKIISENIGFPVKSIQINNDIYNSSEKNMLNIINSIDDKYEFVMITGHNPTFHYLSQLLSNELIIKFPTCSMFAISFNVDLWSEVSIGEKKFMIFPQLYKN